MNAMCILFAEQYRACDLGELSAVRSMASVPFLGRYRLIDFALSSLVHADVRNIGIVTRQKYNSLLDHLGGGKDWDMNRKRGGIRVLTPFAKEEASYSVRNQFEALESVRDYIEKTREDYIILGESNVVTLIDYQAVYQKHLESNADITCVCHEANPKGGDIVLTMGEKDKLLSAKATPQNSKTNEKALLPTGAYFLSKALFLKLLDRGILEGWQRIDREMIARQMDNYAITLFWQKEFCQRIDALENYVSASRALLSPALQKELFCSKIPLLTKTDDSAPTCYAVEASVEQALISDGCTIVGQVKRSILGSEVTVGEGSTVEDCILFKGTTIGKNVSLKHVICDKFVKINDGVSICGSQKQPYVAGKRSVVE